MWQCLRACGKLARSRGKVCLARQLHIWNSHAQKPSISSTSTLRLYLGVNSFAPAMKQRCEDAYFAYETQDCVLIGVADGVSSWKREGIDPSLFSNALMANCLKIAQANHSNGVLCPAAVLEQSFHSIQKNKEVPGGSSTACILVFDKRSGWTKTSNLGDSGYRVFRNGSIFTCSKQQYHHDHAPYYAPYQLAIMPSDEHKYKKYFVNRVIDADVESFFLQDGDVIVMGTDGLFDNLWNDEILEFLPKDIYELNDEDLARVAESLAWEAQEKAQDVSSDRLTPYCQKLYGDSDMLQSACGGNVDDVTVAIAVVRSW